MFLLGLRLTNVTFNFGAEYQFCLRTVLFDRAFPKFSDLLSFVHVDLQMILVEDSLLAKSLHALELLLFSHDTCKLYRKALHSCIELMIKPVIFLCNIHAFLAVIANT